MISISFKQEIIPVSFNSHRIPCVQAGKQSYSDSHRRETGHLFPDHIRPDPDKHHDCALAVSVPADSLPHLKDMAIHRVKKFLLTRVFRDFQQRVECVDRETVTVGLSQKERYPGSSLTYSHGQAYGNLAMVTTAASRRMSYTVSGPRDPSGLALWLRRPSPVPFDS